MEIAGYQAIGPIYRGPSSLVWRAIREADGVPVVIKRLTSTYPSREELTQYKHQFDLTANPPSTGVVRALAFHKVRRTVAIVMEDFGGESLASILVSGPLPIEDGVRIARQVASTLADLHAIGIVHRNISPSSVLVNPSTREVKLTDFRMASMLRREQQTTGPAVRSELAYIAPEQTGRMNAPVDYRSDYYSLGVVLFELLVGEPPFVAADPLDLVYHHLAQTPARPDERNSAISPFLSAIVLKLLAKNPDDRYQSARGILADLDRCLAPPDMGRADAPAVVGAQDVPRGLEIRRRLYGRDREIALIRESLSLARGGSRELTLVGGFSGIGKTALVREALAGVPDSRHRFAAGKFDQLQRNIPYGALVAALQDLLRQILSEADAAVSAWRVAIQTAVAPSGRLLTELMPKLELLIGEQPPVEELPSPEAQDRFDQVFLRFLRTVCEKDRPLVLFLDDLQWVDGASLRLIELALRDEQLSGLFVVGAYRDNEVAASHPLMLAVDRIRGAGAPVATIALGALERPDLTQLLAEAIGESSQELEPFVSLVIRKTGGNPFFLIQFLRALSDHGLITRADDGTWNWDVAQIELEAITNNVVELLLGRMKLLPEESRRALSLAACIGHDFDLQELAAAHGKTTEATFADLLPALQEELIASTSGLALSQTDVLVAKVVMSHFRFLHDRIQQAAYALIPEDRRKPIHLQIGRRLLAEGSFEEQASRMFAIAGHLNLARDLLADDAERLRLAEIDLAAARRAREATALGAALELLRAGMEQLPADVWTRQYPLAMELWRERATLEYLNTDFETSRRFIDEAVARAETALDRADLLHMLVVQHTLAAEYVEAIAVARRALALIGIDLADDRHEAVRDAEMRAVDALLTGRDFRVLSALPPMTDPVKRLAMKLLASMGPPCYRSHQRLWAVIVAMQMRLCLEHGDVPAAAYTYPAYGGLLGYVRGDLSGAAVFAASALAVAEKYGSVSDRSVAHLMIGASLDHWFRPIRDAEEDYRLAYAAGVEAANLQYAVYGFSHLMYCRFFRGANLDEQALDIGGYLGFAQSRRNQWGIDLITGVRMVVHNLTGRTAGVATFSDGDVTEAELIDRCRTNRNVQVVCVYHVLKAHALWVHGRFEEAAAAAREAEERLVSVATQGLLPAAEFAFIDALIAVTLAHTRPDADRPQLRARAAARLAQLRGWAEQCAVNFQHKSLLIEAELADLDDQPWESQRLFDESIAQAAAGGFVHHEAMASECAGRFWGRRGNQERAAAYLRRARHVFGLWGAHAKVALLDGEFAHVLWHEDAGQPAQAPPAGVLATLDLLAVLRASHAIARTVRPDALVEQLMEVVMENAGADRGFLIIPESGDFTVLAAGAQGGRIDRLQARRLSECRDLSAAIVRLVARTGEPVLLDRTSDRSLFRADDYVRRADRCAILCMPVRGHGALAAVLYLENTLSDTAFTAEHVEVLKILAAQAAISFENSKYYAQMEQLVAERTRALEEANERLRSEIERRTKVEAHLFETQKIESIGRLAGGIAHDFNNHLTVINGISQMILDDLPRQDPMWSEIAEVRSAGERAAALTQQLLAFSRKQIIAPRPTNLNSVVLEFENMLRRLIGEDIELRTQCSPSLGTVLADRGQIGQVLVNLATNARDALRGEGSVTIRTQNVELDQAFVEPHPELTPGRHVLLSVADTGCGMAPEIMRRVFDPFFTTKESGKGTGLGLSTVHGIVRQIGGSVIVSSEVGRGTTFDIYFPEIDAKAEADAGPETRDAAPEQRTETVLVVEDQPHVRRLAVRALRRDGFRVLEASTGAEALEVASRCPDPIDLLLTDVVMPGMTGRDLANALSGRRPGLKVLFTSGYTADIIAPKGVLDAGLAFLPKPFHLELLRERVVQLLDGTEAAQTAADR